MDSETRPGAMSRLAGASLRFAGAIFDVAETAPLAGPAITWMRTRTVDLVEATRVRVATAVRAVLGAVIREVVVVLTETVDLTDLVLHEVDLDRLVAAVLEVIDLDAVIETVDLDRAVAQVDLMKAIDLVDLDEVIRKVDLDAVADLIDIDAIAARIDIDAILDRVDLVGLAEEIIDGVDLPDIIREASTSVTADVMTDVRSTSERADDAVANAVNRFLRRRSAESEATAAIEGSDRDGAGE